MIKNIIPILVAAALTFWGLNVMADDRPAKSANAAEGQTTEARPPSLRKTQSDAASKTAKFGTVSTSSLEYQSALDAHALEPALKRQNKSGAFKGTVTAIYEPRAGGLAIMNFDADYKKAISALLRGNDFTNFPDLKKLVGKEVLVSGKFMAYQGRAEIVLTNVDQVKLVETAK
jgi:hypothetical protein